MNGCLPRSKELHAVLFVLALLIYGANLPCAIGQASTSRTERTFIGMNCAAIPPSLIASELFGQEKGAFTGATQRRLGRLTVEGSTWDTYLP
jgi:transcriptional regulator with AAA-type ATPase domain